MLCEISNAENIQEIEKIDNGLILLNNFNSNLTQNNKIKYLKGTYLIHFWNETININNNQFSNMKKKYPKTTSTTGTNVTYRSKKATNTVFTIARSVTHQYNDTFLYKPYWHTFTTYRHNKLWLKPIEKIIVKFQQRTLILNN